MANSPFTAVSKKIILPLYPVHMALIVERKLHLFS